MCVSLRERRARLDTLRAQIEHVIGNDAPVCSGAEHIMRTECLQHAVGMLALVCSYFSVRQLSISHQRVRTARARLTQRRVDSAQTHTMDELQIRIDTIAQDTGQTRRTCEQLRLVYAVIVCIYPPVVGINCDMCGTV
jgi:hypothetical protein